MVVESVARIENHNHAVAAAGDSGMRRNRFADPHGEAWAAYVIGP